LKMLERFCPCGGWMRSIAILGLSLTMALGTRAAAAAPAAAPTGASTPTLVAGPMPNLAGRVASPAARRGDVVVFRLPDASGTYVRRVIGLPGERIEMRRGQLYIDGQVAPRRLVGTVTVERNGVLVPLLQYIETLPNGREHDILKISDDQPLDNTAEFIVPLHSYFVLADSRDAALDSRVPASAGGIGFVPETSLIGRVDLVRFSGNPAVARDMAQRPGASP
jgi:signal peptidase I